MLVYIVKYVCLKYVFFKICLFKISYPLLFTSGPPPAAKVTATAVTFYMCPPIAAVTFLCSYTSGLVFLRRGLCPVAQEPPCQPPVSYEAHNLGIKKASLKPSF